MSSDHVDQLLTGALIDNDVLSAHPDYTAVLIAATGLEPGPSSATSEALLLQAEAFAAEFASIGDLGEAAAIAPWRAAYASFGVKPRHARSSVESLLRRAGSGLPRVDRLTDTYNAVSVLQLTPIGGEDLAGYVGAPRLAFAVGDEQFDTMADGEPLIDHPDAGEVVWRDDLGVTCRRWNWRQCVRTRLTNTTTDALFIIDGLGPDSRARATTCADALIAGLAEDSPAARFRTHVLPVDE
jgi:DNA/RNA-binding domain of Phe-tRNA-synthetase-like protein